LVVSSVKLREPATRREYTIFLSSSDEAEFRRLRERIQRLIYDRIVPALVEHYPQTQITLRVCRWEQHAPQYDPERSVNEIFVEQARRAHFVLVLLFDEIRPGTRQELEAALAASVDVKILVFDRPGQVENSNQEMLLKSLKATYGLLYEKCGCPDDEATWFGVFGTLLTLTLQAMADSERRGRSPLDEVRE
jgi:hypothetical protein